MHILIYIYIIYTFINIHIFKSKWHFSEHFWIAVVTVYFSTTYGCSLQFYQILQLRGTLHRQILGKIIDLRMIILAGKKIKYQNQTDLLKTHTELSSHAHRPRQIFPELLHGNTHSLKPLESRILPHLLSSLLLMVRWMEAAQGHHSEPTLCSQMGFVFSFALT